MPTSYITPGVQNLEMSWNILISMLTKRKDVIKGGKEESFTFDNLYRLTGSTITGSSTQSVSYSANGNISTKTDAGTYSYHATKVNAVTQVTNPGSTISTLTQDISYTSFMQPHVISETVGSTVNELTYTYGANYQRLKGVLKQGGSVVNTRYYLSSCEKNVIGSMTTYVHYINSPAGVVAMVVREGFVEYYRYVYTDHLGSIVTVTDNSANVIAEQNFDAWGRRRDPLSWALLAPTAATGLPYWLYRGYTGHEHLDNFGLINMNGRMYDPVVARMHSPDNHVPNVGLTQDFNRYSYARNNPLVYTDPDGEWIQIVIGAVVGGVSQGIASMKAGGYFWDGAWKGALIGAVSGATALGATALTAGASLGAVATGTASVGFGATLVGSISGGVASGAMGTAVNGGKFGRNLLNGAIGGAVGGIFPSIGVTGVLPGAATGAATGGLAGGITSFLTGGNFGEGFKQGAISGAITGGIFGGMAAKSSEYERNIIFGNLTRSARQQAFLDYAKQYGLREAGAARIVFENLDEAYGVTRALDPKTGERIHHANAGRLYPEGVDSEVAFTLNRIMSLKKIGANVLHERQHVIDLRSGMATKFLKMITNNSSAVFDALFEISAHRAVYNLGIQKGYNAGRIKHWEQIYRNNN